MMNEGKPIINTRMALHPADLANSAPIEWITSQNPVPYPDAIAFMESRVEAIVKGEKPECVWLLEHPSLYTAGTSAKSEDLLVPSRFPVFQTGRGGQYTYHGPNQRVAYVMLNLKTRKQDVRLYVAALEQWLKSTLAHCDIEARSHEDRVGLWVKRPDKGKTSEDKIAAIGIRVRHWVTYHGISLNVAPDLTHFAGIIPCGVKNQGVTSFKDLGKNTSMSEIDEIMKSTFTSLFSLL